MIRTISDFEHLWSAEIENTQKVFKHLTNESLTKVIHPDVRTLGRIAWHITITIPEMCGKMGLNLAGPKENDPIPATAKEILKGYSDAAISLLEEVKKNWKDETLEVVNDMYGEKWKRGFTLEGFVKHEIHHRGEMIALMRIAGLAVPGLYGPTREEWAQYGMPPPEV
ncbi:MAG: DinB family protein [Bacteroidetes bacterium]|nr:DinB family protein [Bacteroidota bacterium]MCW5896872.1 DinB family protein [Bacteroidota bacterium]